MSPLNLCDHRPLFSLPMTEDHVRTIDANHRAVSRDDDHLETVQRMQLRRSGLGSTGHAA